MDEIKKILASFSGEIYDLCFELLHKNEDNAKTFEYVCSTFTKVPRNGDYMIEKHFSEAEIEEYESIHGDIVNGLINSTAKRCNAGLLRIDDFYISLWHAFCANFTTEKEKAFAFYYTLIDSSIPFLYLGKPISMSNERFQAIVESNQQIINKLFYIQKSRYNQQTERASLLLNCLAEIDDLETKAVVLSQAINIFSRNRLSSTSIDLDGLIQQIDRKIEEVEQQEKTDAEK